MATIDWDARTGSGREVPVSDIAADAIRCMAMRIASAHYEQQNTNPNVIGYGAALAHHLPQSNPAEWRRFVGVAIEIIKSLHGSGEKDLSGVGVKDGQSYFAALADLAADLRHRV